MSRRNKVIAGLIFLALSIAFLVCGIVLFNLVPDGSSSDLLSKKEVLLLTGTIFSFIFALGTLGGSVAFFINALEREYY